MVFLQKVWCLCKVGLPASIDLITNPSQEYLDIVVDFTWDMPLNNISLCFLATTS